MAQHRCQFCWKTFETQRALNHHISASKACYKEWRKELVRNEHPSLKRPKENSSGDIADEWDVFEDDNNNVDDFVPNSPPSGGVLALAPEKESAEGGSNLDVERFIESYPGDAGRGLRKSKTEFENWFENQKDDQKNPWDPFASEEEWALSVWLIKHVGQKSTDEFLKLPIVSEISGAFNKKELKSPTFSRLIAERNYRSIIVIHS